MDTLILRGNTAHCTDKYKFWDPITAQGRPTDQTTIRWHESFLECGTVLLGK